MNPAVGGLGGPLVDHCHLGQHTTPTRLGVPTRAPAAPASTQHSRPLATQPTQFGAVDRLVNRLGDKVTVGLVGELLAQRISDLFRAPALVQPIGHKSA